MFLITFFRQNKIDHIQPEIHANWNAFSYKMTFSICHLHIESVFFIHCHCCCCCCCSIVLVIFFFDFSPIFTENVVRRSSVDLKVSSFVVMHHHMKIIVAFVSQPIPNFLLFDFTTWNLFIATILFENYGLNIYWRYHSAVRIKYELSISFHISAHIIEYACVCVHVLRWLEPMCCACMCVNVSKSVALMWLPTIFTAVMISWLTKNWQFDVGNISISITFIEVVKSNQPACDVMRRWQ